MLQCFELIIVNSHQSLNFGWALRLRSNFWLQMAPMLQWSLAPLLLCQSRDKPYICAHQKYSARPEKESSSVSGHSVKDMEFAITYWMGNATQLDPNPTCRSQEMYYIWL